MAYNPNNGFGPGYNFDRGLAGGGATGADYLSGAGAAASGTAAVLGAIQGFQGLAQAKDEFGVETEFANRNMVNQGTQINADYANRRGIGLAASGLSQAQQTAYNAANPVTSVNTDEITVPA